MDQWEINKPLGECFGSGRKIEYGEEYFAALVETGQGFQRQDYSREFWDSNKPSVYCYWRTKLPSPDQKKHIFIDDEMLMAFFERLSQETEQEKINFRFVLALILMRKRRLKYDSSRTGDDGMEIWHLRVVGEDRFVDVVNPNLDEKQIGQLSSQISLILQVNI